MNPKQTWFWVLVAAGLCTFIFLVERRQPAPPAGPAALLSGFQASAVTGLQIQPAGQRLMRLERTNETWRLTEPISYPAQTAVVGALLKVLERLAPFASLTAEELKNLPKADQEFGFTAPQLTLVLDRGGAQTRVQIGNRTAPGDQVFVQVVGVERVFIVDAELLKFIPRDVNQWRDPALADWRQIAFDRVLVTNLGKVLALQLDPTNRLWRMTLPMEARADCDKVLAALRQLGALRAAQFVTDDPKADLEPFGLQAPELSLTLMRGTNSLLTLDFGKTLTNDATQVFARREGQPSVVVVSKAPVESWRASHDFFRDRHLVRLTAPLDEIEVQARDHFTLRQQADHWLVLPQNFPADTAWVTNLIGQLRSLQVTQFVKDVVTAPDLPAWGLTNPVSQFILKTTVTNAAGDVTNAVLAQLDFGTNQEDLIFVRRADESPVYAVKLAEFQNLPDASWQLRDRRVWDFSENDVAQITIHQAGKVRELVRNGPEKWTFAPGSQGIMDDVVAAALDEAAHRLGQLSAAAWAAGPEASRADFGFTPRSHRIEVALKNGAVRTLEIGGTAPSGLPFAAAAPEREPWILELPLGVYQMVLTYLTIPANVP